MEYIWCFACDHELLKTIVEDEGKLHLKNYNIEREKKNHCEGQVLVKRKIPFPTQ